MFKKIIFGITVLLCVCITVCAEGISYNSSEKTIKDIGKYAIVKKAKLYTFQMIRKI